MKRFLLVLSCGITNANSFAVKASLGGQNGKEAKKAAALRWGSGIHFVWGLRCKPVPVL
ncbi:MAG: hypothetical protein AABO41_23575 [Acidobacteriota bacterium]